jgi:hypothetical protein
VLPAALLVVVAMLATAGGFEPPQPEASRPRLASIARPKEAVGCRANRFIGCPRDFTFNIQTAESETALNCDLSQHSRMTRERGMLLAPPPLPG